MWILVFVILFFVDIAKDHAYLTLEIPKRGGHVGFVEFSPDKLYWSERRALSFLEMAHTDPEADVGREALNG